MKNIVLYTLMAAGLLMLFTETTGQKPTIDLLPFNHKQIHPEAVIDTGFSKDSVVKFFPGDKHSPVILKEKEKRKIKRRESWKSWFDMDSLFQKQVSKNNRTGKRPGKYFLFLRQINPIKLIIHITALKI